MQKIIEPFQFVGSTTPNRRVCIVERHPISYVAPVTSILELCHSARCGNQTHYHADYETDMIYKYSFHSLAIYCFKEFRRSKVFQYHLSMTFYEVLLTFDIHIL